jgi:N-acetylneuraminic acid mutarotase
LVVNDSEADAVTVTAATANSAPVANAGPDQNIVTGSLVTLDGSVSSDANDDLLTYNWSFVSVPARSAVSQLTDPTTVAPSFTADVTGNYVVGLIVNDGLSESMLDTVTITSSVVTQTWVSGSSQAYQDGVYGVLGVSSASNMPGARQGNFSWIDNNGNLWFFGGWHYNPTDFPTGTNESYNDLWKYDITINEWTWMGGSNIPNQPGTYGVLGVPATTNIPGARSGNICWKDTNGDFWLFGGSGYDSLGTVGFLNDMWRYDISAEEWTWMGGSNIANQPGSYGSQNTPNASNVPGARGSGAIWVDHNGNLWLFGGSGYDGSSVLGFMNDLWFYEISTETWTWLGGHQFANQPANYGIIGTPDPANIPGPRSSSYTWVDSNNDLWLFAGFGYDSVGDFNYLNDLWHFDTTTGQWAWESGSNLANQIGHYGTQGVADSGNVPGARWGSVTWVGNNNDLWLFGGYYQNNPPTNVEFYSDFWRFDVSTGNWIWEDGFQSPNQPGIYGTKGVVDETNFSGGRYGSSLWNEDKERIWIFGGAGLDSTGTAGYLNDLWKIDVP